MKSSIFSRLIKNRLFLILLAVSIPVLVWAIVTQRFELRRKAVSTEPSICTPAGNSITVTPQGGPGTCHDLQTAIDAVTGPDFDIYVRAGDYEVDSLPDDSFSIRITGKTRLTVHGENGPGGAYANLFFRSRRGGVRIENSTGVRFEWFHLNGSTANGMLSVNNSSETHITYVTMYDMSAHTFDIQGGSDNFLTNCNVKSSAGGIVIGGVSDFTVSNCTVTETEDAIAVNDATGRIFGNTIYNNRQSGIRVSNSTVTAEQNTVTGNGGQGSQYWAGLFVQNPTGQTSTVTLKNTIFFDNNIGVSLDTPSAATINADHIDVWGNRNGDTRNWQYPLGVSGNIAANPLFGQNYCIGTNSPALYGNPANFEYMGSRGVCTGPITPTPSYAVTPTPTPTTIPVTNCSGQPNGTLCTTTVCSPAPCHSAPGICVDNACIPSSSTTAPTPSATPVPPTPTRPATPTPTPPVYPYRFDVNVRFNGVADAQAEAATVTVRFVNGTLDLVTPPIPVTHVGGGVYLARFAVAANQLPPGGGYRVIVKGEKHVAMRYCLASGQTGPCQSGQNITLIAPVSDSQVTYLNFTGFALDPGDLYPQDGRADAADFAKIRERLNISNPTASDLRTADLNYDGVINILDAFWMRKTLETRYDEN